MLQRAPIRLQPSTDSIPDPPPPTVPAPAETPEPDPVAPQAGPFDPKTPLATCTPVPFAPAASRHLELWGAPVELVWVPHRNARPGIPGTARPALRPSPAARILLAEATAADARVAVTPNRYPFTADAGILWRRLQGQREPDRAMFAAMAEVAAAGTTVLWNTVGAAATIPRSHAHLTRERLPFLPALAWQPAAGDWVESLRAAVPEVAIHTAAAPCPVWMIQLQGSPAALTAALLVVQELRTTAAANGVLHGDRAWLLPRSTVEIPAPHFPHAFGGAEFWGRWCFPDQNTFERASAEDLAAAFETTAVLRSPD